MKKTKSIYKYILLVEIILTCLFALSIPFVFAWFSDTSGDIPENVSDEFTGNHIYIETVVGTGQMDINLYNNSISTENLVSNLETASNNGNYIDLTSVVIPEANVDLVLILENVDVTNLRLYLRYKFELFVDGKAEDIPVDLILEKNSGNDIFVKDDDGYYYYTNGESTNQYMPEYTSSCVLMNGFTVPFSSFQNIYNSSNIYIRLTIESSITSNFQTNM